MALADPQPHTEIRDSVAAAALLAPCFDGAAQEELHVLHLDAELRFLGFSTSMGEAHAVELPVRLLIAEALALGARAMVIAHNHPHGDPLPTPADRRATRQLAEVARGLDIRLIDHLIFAGGGWTSFRAMGLL